MFSAVRTTLRPSSIRGRLALWHLSLFGAALLVLASAVFALHVRMFNQELNLDLKRRAREFALDFGPVLWKPEAARALAADPRLNGVGVVVRSPSGGVIFRSAAFPALDEACERRLAEAARERRPLVTAQSPSGGPIRVATLVAAGAGGEELTIQIGASTAAVRRALARQGAILGLLVLLILAAAAYGGAWTARRALAPVEDVVARVRQLQPENVGDRLPAPVGSEEMDRLVATLNEMLDRIAMSVRSARRFAADASHELQTPLTNIRTALEVAEGEEASPDLRRLASELKAEVDALSALVRDLLLLAQADGALALEKTERVDVGELARECAEIAAAIAGERGIQIDVFVRECPPVEGSPRHLRRVMLNLLENAVRHSAPASKILITVARARGHAMVAVLDHGCGIGPSDLPHIFEPFYRADPARARETGGAGLGLSIAQQLVRLHGGRIKVASVPGRGSTFAVYLPEASPGTPDLRLG